MSENPFSNAGRLANEKSVPKFVRQVRRRFAGSRTMRAIQGIVIFLATGPATACWDQAATKYGVNPYLLYAIAKTESGLNPSAMNRNKDGSYDVGLMQINSRWFPVLRKYGLDEQQLMDACTSIEVGAWILAQNIQRLGNSWDAVGAYNSSNPAFRLRYALKVYKNIPPAVLAGQ